MIITMLHQGSIGASLRPQNNRVVHPFGDICLMLKAFLSFYSGVLRFMLHERERERETDS